MNPTETAPWPAPVAVEPVDAVVRVPGSKSATNRALVLAALADGPGRIREPLVARDTRLMAAALSSMGVLIEEVGDGWRVAPGVLRGDVDIDCGLAGTVMRFVPPVAGLAQGDVRFDGDPRARVRPMSGVLSGLRALGVGVSDEGSPALPFTVHGRGRIAGGEITLDASASSQFVSGLMLAAPRFDNPTTIRHSGPPVPSLPHIDMTVDMLRSAGVSVDGDAADPRSAWWRVEPGPIRAADLTIEPDLSNAGPFLAAAAATGGRITIPDWPMRTTQAGDRLRELLRAMGAQVDLTEDGLTVVGPGSGLLGLEADLRDVGELTPVIAALCALAATPSHLTGIGHLRGHETDRLAALANELNRIGGRVEEESDGLKITPAALSAGVFETYDDHRMATAGAVLGLVVPGIEIVDVATTAKTLPHFTSMWAAMLTGRS